MRDLTNNFGRCGMPPRGSNMQIRSEPHALAQLSENARTLTNPFVTLSLVLASVVGGCR
jgi:hypothetical protein